VVEAEEAGAVVDQVAQVGEVQVLEVQVRQQLHLELLIQVVVEAVVVAMEVALLLEVETAAQA
jgi:hypothetical protein